MVFFVISGYLVTASWYHDPHAIRFAIRRVLRVWPALTAVVVLTAYALGGWVTELPLKEYFLHRATLDYLMTLRMKIHYALPGVFVNNPYPHGVNGSLWTIPLEVRCYAVLALAGLFGLMRSRIVWALLIGAYMAWFFAKGSADFTGRLHYGRELSAFFLAGSLLYISHNLWTRRPVLWLLALSAGAAIAWQASLRYTAVLALLPFLVIWIGTQSTPIIRRFGRWGDPSYGIYLIAFPVQQTVIHFLWPTLGFEASMALAAVITVSLAYISWHTIEKTALRYKPRRRHQ